MNFASDNTAPVAPAILDALVEANRGFALGYGNDDWTHAIERRFCEIFEREVAAFLVPTGTASNALAWRRSRHPGASSSAIPNPTSRPMNVVHPNFSAMVSSLSDLVAMAAKSAPTD